MIFSTVTKSGAFQFVQKDSTEKIDIQEVEKSIIAKFNAANSLHGVTLAKFSEHIPLSFVLVAESTYNSDGNDSNEKRNHPTYNVLILCTGHLSSIADGYNLKCTRRGT